MNTEYKEKTISENTTFEDVCFTSYDFTKTNLANVVFKNVNFSGCLFQKTNLDHTRFWCCFFDDCEFTSVNLSATYLGSWGGGLSGCVFQKCKFGKIINASYFIDCTFDRCKLKATYFQTYLMRNIRFVGLIDDLSFQKFFTKEIYEYQQPGVVKKVEDKIRERVGSAFDRTEVVLHNIDFSACKTLFTSFENCTVEGIIPPNDENELLVNNIDTVAKKVYDDIALCWPDADTKSWALRCTENYFNRTTEIISFYELKHFENEEFAEKLMHLFRKYSDS